MTSARRLRAWICALMVAAPLGAAGAPPNPEARAAGFFGLVRVRDLTPFGILRLDFLTLVASAELEALRLGYLFSSTLSLAGDWVLLIGKKVKFVFQRT